MNKKLKERLKEYEVGCMGSHWQIYFDNHPADLDDILSFIDTNFISKDRIRENLDNLKERVDYNKHDLGEFGHVIRTKYVYNFIEDLKHKLLINLLNESDE